jgi:hypothetical protein
MKLYAITVINIIIWPIIDLYNSKSPIAQKKIIKHMEYVMIRVIISYLFIYLESLTNALMMGMNIKFKIG